MTYRILVTDDIYTSGLELLQAETDVRTDVEYGLSVVELRKRVADYDAVITRSGTALDADFFAAAAGHLKVAARAGVALDNVDIEAATRSGVMVMNIPEVNAVAAAEMALALMLALCRNLPQSNALMRAGKWERLPFMGVHLEGKTLGLVGLGRVGRRVAARAHAFGMRVIAFDPYVPDEIADGLKVELVEELDPLLERADFVSLHCQLTDETQGLIGAEQIGRMRPGARIVNMARGGLIDESALLAALESGHLAGAALDVFQTEPPAGPSADLIQHPNVVATPHLGASTYEAQHDVSTRIVRQVLDALRGAGYHNVVNLPFADGEDYRKLAPFMLLAEKIGSLQMQLMDGKNIPAGMQVHVAYRGEELNEYAKPLAVALLKGLLTPMLGESVNYVNAPYLANEHGLSVHQMTASGMDEYSNVVACRLVAGSEKRLIAGTLLTRSQPRIVRLDDIPMDVLPEGFMLAIESRDIPGVIAQVASLLGESKLNIAEYRLGRDKPGGTAFSFINLDSEAPEAVLVQLRGLPPVIEVKQVCL
jgi:D-3-phosphoglycerate dehydrogenase / 2-oxoglutarate reductase